jgi:hypothetical protein
MAIVSQGELTLSSNGNKTAATSIAVTTTATPAVGDLVVVMCGRDDVANDTVPDTLTDTHGNTWNKISATRLATVGTALDGVVAVLFWSKITTAFSGTTTLTWSWTNNATAKSVRAFRYSGVDTIDGTPGTANASSTSVAVSVTPSAAGALVIGFAAREGAAGATASNDTDTTNGEWSSTSRSSLTTGGTAATNVSTLYAEKIVTASGAQTFNSTIGTSTDWAAIGVAFSADLAQTVTAQRASLVLSAIQRVVSDWSDPASATTTGTGGPTVTAQRATLALSAVSGAMTGGPTTVTAQPATLALFGVSGLLPSAFPGRYPTSVDATAKQILDQHGDPWFGVGDTAWSLSGQLSPADIEFYFDEIAAKGVNFVLFSAPEAVFTDNTPPSRNQQGDLPFTGTAFQSSLNEAYWAVVDDAITYAGALGITCLVCPQYIGYFDSEGWGAELTAAYNANPANLTNYGAAIAARYAAYPNIVWLIGHDRSSMTSQQVAGSKLIADELAADTHHLICVGGDEADTYGDTTWSGSGIATDFDTVYDYDDLPGADTAARWVTKTLIYLEGRYEDGTGGLGVQLLRRQYWEPWMAGASAAIFGNTPRWHFNGSSTFGGIGTWQQSLNNSSFNAGTRHLAQLGAFIGDLGDAWWSTVPDATGTFLTSSSGFARFDTLTGIIYTTSTSSITVDTAEMVGTSNVRIRRFDPTNGAYTTVAASEAQSSSRSISYPGTNSAGHSDWVYLIDVPDAPQTVTAQRASLVLSAIQRVVSDWSDPASVTTVGGPQTVTAQVATLTLSAVSGTATGGPASLTAQVGSLALGAVQGSPSVGSAPPQTVTAQVATLTLSAVSGTATGGPASLTAQVGSLALSAISGATTGGATSLTAQVATLTLSAVSGTPSTDGAFPQTVTAQVATLGLAPVSGVVTGGASSITAQRATLELVGIAGTSSTPAPGSQTVTAQPAVLTIAGRTSVPFGGAATITAQPSTVVLDGVSGAPVGGPVTLLGQRATLLLAGVSGLMVFGKLFAPGSVVTVIRGERRQLTVIRGERQQLVVVRENRTLEVPDE